MKTALVNPPTRDPDSPVRRCSMLAGATRRGGPGPVRGRPPRQSKVPRRMMAAVLKSMTSPLTSTSVATKGAEALAGSKPNRRRMKGSIEPAMAPHSTTPQQASGLGQSASVAAPRVHSSIRAVRKSIRTGAGQHRSSDANRGPTRGHPPRVNAATLLRSSRRRPENCKALADQIPRVAGPSEPSGRDMAIASALATAPPGT